MFFARHGVTGEETLSGSAAERLGGARDDFRFRAAYIGDERARRQRGCETFDQVENGNDGCCQNDEIAAVHRIGGVRRARLDRSALDGAFENGRAVAANDAAGEMTLAERETH